RHENLRPSLPRGCETVILLTCASWQSPLIVTPVLHGTVDIGFLRALAAAAQEKHDGPPCLSV
ncbi:MAG: hypothetical protein ACREVA_06820, partial [Burkholderiales bacterium]